MRRLLAADSVVGGRDLPESLCNVLSMVVISDTAWRN